MPFLSRVERRIYIGRLAARHIYFRPLTREQIRAPHPYGGGDFLCPRQLRETGENFYFGKDSVDTKVRIFELTMWPHMRAAYNLARWLVRNDHDAEDIVQESFLKAYKAQESFRGSEAKTWMLSIVRNTAMDFLRRYKSSTTMTLDEPGYEPQDDSPDPERVLLEQSRRDQVRQAISQLEPEFREAIVLREIEGLSYKEIAAVLNIPMGTVMSRLSRARNLLLVELGGSKEVQHDLP
jgi:RNA polymerase sigma-70 factor (ECF subfamily)